MLENAWQPLSMNEPVASVEIYLFELSVLVDALLDLHDLVLLHLGRPTRSVISDETLHALLEQDTLHSRLAGGRRGHGSSRWRRRRTRARVEDAILDKPSGQVRLSASLHKAVGFEKAPELFCRKSLPPVQLELHCLCVDTRLHQLRRCFTCIAMHQGLLRVAIRQVVTLKVVHLHDDGRELLVACVAVRRCDLEAIHIFVKKSKLCLRAHFVAPGGRGCLRAAGAQPARTHADRQQTVLGRALGV
mmetsp:Transcript_55093/g.163989  ORF Transcript_55093/g.163989 Transcript_55093/m.163989 type:complete len:246 (+) Transcript_55093:222-959(+)